MGLNLLSETQIKFLTYLVYILIAVLTLVTAWNTDKISAISENLPLQYVQKERYLCDQARIEKKLDRILDHLERP